MSFELYPCASLVLDTRHVQLADGGGFNNNLNDLNNSKGQFSEFGQTILFKNIDWMAVLGSMYGKYRSFNIRMTSIVYLASSAAGGQGSGDWGGSVFYIRMTNASMNGSYNHLLGLNDGYSPLFSCSMVQTTAGAHAQFSALTPNLLTFSPTQRYSDITLDCRNVKSLGGKVTDRVMGHCVFICDVFPILESKI